MSATRTLSPCCNALCQSQQTLGHLYPCHHALCNVHHLRELTFVEEELKQPWAKKMKELLLDMKEEVAQARQAGQMQLDVVKLANFHFQYGALIREGLELNPKVPPSPGNKRMKQSPPWNLLDRLNRYRADKFELLRLTLPLAGDGFP